MHNSRGSRRMRPEVKRILVLGGSNTDLTAVPLSGRLVPGTSNPGRVVLAPGGVGRNIAANLGYLGLPVSLLSAVEDSPLGDSLLAMTEAAGVDVSRVRRGDPGESGVYVAVHDGSGDAFVAGLVARLYEGGSMEEAIKYGIGAARLILRLPETTTPELSPENVEEEVKRCFYR